MAAGQSARCRGDVDQAAGFTFAGAQMAVVICEGSDSRGGERVAKSGSAALRIPPMPWAIPRMDAVPGLAAGRASRRSAGHRNRT